MLTAGASRQVLHGGCSRQVQCSHQVRTSGAHVRCARQVLTSGASSRTMARCGVFGALLFSDSPEQHVDQAGAGAMDPIAESPELAKRIDRDVSRLSAIAKMILGLIQFAERQSQVANELLMALPSEPFRDQRRDAARRSSDLVVELDVLSDARLRDLPSTRILNSSPNCQQINSSSFRATPMRTKTA